MLVRVGRYNTYNIKRLAQITVLGATVRHYRNKNTIYVYTIYAIYLVQGL